MTTKAADCSGVCSKKLNPFIHFCMKKFTWKKLIVAAAAGFAAAMVAFPAVTEAGAKSAISIWLNSVVPVLLPFFIFADFLKRTVDMERIPVKVYPMAMAFMSGYPMGAKIVGDLVREGILSPEKGRHVLSYSLVTGPAFILGTVGIFLGNSQAAAIAAISHYAGALVNGCLWRCDGRVEFCRLHGSLERREANYMDHFTESILVSFRSMAIILAYLVVFMIGADLLETLKILDFLPDETWRSFAKGLMEMTMGTSAVGMCNISLGLKTVLTAFLISFGGLSVIGQSLSVSGGWISAGALVEIKLTHGLLAGIIASVFILAGNIVYTGQFMV